MKANRTLVIWCLISLTSNLNAAKENKQIPQSKIVVLCAALFGTGCIFYQAYQFIWGHPELDRRVRRIDERVDKLVESSEALESEVRLIKEQAGIIDTRTEQIQATQTAHGQTLKELDKRTQDMTDHLLAIRKKQAEHSETLEVLRQELIKLHQTGASKSEIERCETAIKELMAKHYQSLTGAFDQLKTSHQVDLHGLKEQLLQANTQGLDALEQRLGKLVATESFITQRCDQLKDELRQEIRATIRDEFNHARSNVGLEPRPPLIKQAKLLKTTAT